MDGLQRVTFRFGSDVEVRYLPAIPRSGDFVTRGHDLWEVAFVSSESVGMTVICELRDGDDGRAANVA